MTNTEVAVTIYSQSQIHSICEYAFRNQCREERMTYETLGKKIGRSKGWVSDVINGRAKPSLEDSLAFVRACNNPEAERMLEHLMGFAPPPTDPYLTQDLSTCLNNLEKQCQDVIEAIKEFRKWELKKRPGMKLQMGMKLSQEEEQYLNWLGKQIEDLDQSSDDAHIVLFKRFGIHPSIHKRNWLLEARSNNIVVDCPSKLMQRQRHESLFGGGTSL